MSNRQRVLKLGRQREDSDRDLLSGAVLRCPERQNIRNGLRGIVRRCPPLSVGTLCFEVEGFE